MKNSSENNKLKVLHLLSGFQVGGQEKLILSQIRENIKNRQNNCEYLIAVMNDIVNEQMKEELLSTGIKAYFLGRKQSSKNPVYLFKLLNIILSNKVNIIHSHNTGSRLWSILCKLVCPGLRTVYTIHDLIHIENLKALQLIAQRLFIDKNIAVSETIKGLAIKKGLNKTRTIVNAIDTENYKTAKRTPYSGSCLNIINVARIMLPKKGQDILIKALAICRDSGLDFKCRFVGGEYAYDTTSMGYLKGLVAKLNLEDNIEFLGNRNDVAELLAESDIFVLPSRFEGTPLTLLEAMASGLPVITSKIPGCIEIINDEENGLFFESENIDELAQKILYLAKNPALMKKLSEHSLKTSEAYDIARFNKAQTELYRALLSPVQ